MTTKADYTMQLNLTDSAAPTTVVPNPPDYQANALNGGGSLNAASTPAVTVVAAGTVTLAGGAATLDLTALLGLDGTARTLSGLKVRQLFLFNNSANAMTVSKGSVNGHTGFGSAFNAPIAAGGRLMIDLVSGGVAVSGTNKTLDFAGTLAQTCLYEITAGA